MTPALASRTPTDERRRTVISRQVIRSVDPEEPDAIFMLLASKAAGWITAQTYRFNNGYELSQ
jgi:hypothetical protein